MTPISPQPQGSGFTAISPRTSSMSQRPALMKRGSSQNQVYSTRNIGRSPGSELEAQPLRRPGRKGHARIVLPRNHSSGHNLARLARQAEHEGRPNKSHTRQRSHEGDTEIRLPGSLEESEARPPPIRRNLTAYNLPRNASHAKLKKNFSHGQLQRLTNTKDLAPLTSNKQKPPTSPGIRNKSRRPKSVDWIMEKDLHQQEVELAVQQQEKKDASRKVGFDVGDDSEQGPQMEGSGLDEGEWTEESASVSPYSTRQNTANNSRRESVQQDRTNLVLLSHHNISKQESETDEDSTETEVDAKIASDGKENKIVFQRTQVPEAESTTQSVQRSPLHAAKEHPNPTTQFLRRNSNQLPAPALVSNVTAMDDTRSIRESPSASLQASNMTGDQDELVSRFMPSTSNGSGANTTMQNTPKSSFHTPEDDYTHRERPFSLGPVSPGSTVSGSSGAATPALGRSRIELRMLQEKALADMESAAEKGPIIPAHVYDRRNETLKSYLQLATLAQANGVTMSNMPLSLGPEIFQGRFKAVNTELKVVQKFRNPLAESVARLQSERGSKLNTPVKQANALRTSKSAVSLPVRSAATTVKKDDKMSSSISPPSTVTATAAIKPSLTASRSSVMIKPTARRTASRGVSFVGMDDERDKTSNINGEMSLDDIAKQMWDSVVEQR